MLELSQLITSIYPLSNASVYALLQIIEVVSRQKGHILFHENEIHNELYIIQKGYARAFTEIKDTNTTFWFGGEGTVLLSMNSVIHNEKGYESIMLLEDSELLKMNYQKLQNLYSSNIEIANWGRVFLGKELVKTEKRLIDRLVKPATERYLDLLLHHPDTIQRVPLQYIASYLGITQVSLSRIRSEIGKT